MSHHLSWRKFFVIKFDILLRFSCKFSPKTLRIFCQENWNVGMISCVWSIAFKTFVPETLPLKVQRQCNTDISFHTLLYRQREKSKTVSPRMTLDDCTSGAAQEIKVNITEKKNGTGMWKLAEKLPFAIMRIFNSWRAWEIRGAFRNLRYIMLGLAGIGLVAGSAFRKFGVDLKWPSAHCCVKGELRSHETRIPCFLVMPLAIRSNVDLCFGVIQARYMPVWRQCVYFLLCFLPDAVK